MTFLIEEKLSNENEKIIKNLELKISELSRNREKLIELNLNSIISNDELKVRIEKIDNEIKKVNKKMKSFEFIDNEKLLNVDTSCYENIIYIKE